MFFPLLIHRTLLYIYPIGGLSGTFNQFSAYQRYCRTTSARAQMFERTLEMCGMVTDPDAPKAGKHRELEAAKIRKSEEAVQRTITAIKIFTNPSTIPDKSRLYSIASGAPVSSDIENDVLQAEVKGKEAKEEFIKDRLGPTSPEKCFFERIKKLKLKTMDNNNKKVTLTASKGKV